jgi:prophage regulatory protein
VQFLTDIQAGDRYGVSSATIRRWVRTIPSFPRPINLSPGCTRWRLEDLVSYETGLSAAATEPANEPASADQPPCRGRGRPRKSEVALAGVNPSIVATQTREGR